MQETLTRHCRISAAICHLPYSSKNLILVPNLKMTFSNGNIISQKA